MPDLYSKSGAYSILEKKNNRPFRLFLAIRTDCVFRVCLHAKKKARENDKPSPSIVRIPLCLTFNYSAV